MHGGGGGGGVVGTWRCTGFLRYMRGVGVSRKVRPSVYPSTLSLNLYKPYMILLKWVMITLNLPAGLEMNSLVFQEEWGRAVKRV